MEEDTQTAEAFGSDEEERHSGTCWPCAMPSLHCLPVLVGSLLRVAPRPHTHVWGCLYGLTGGGPASEAPSPSKVDDIPSIDDVDPSAQHADEGCNTVGPLSQQPSVIASYTEQVRRCPAFVEGLRRCCHEAAKLRAAQVCFAWRRWASWDGCRGPTR